MIRSRNVIKLRSTLDTIIYIYVSAYLIEKGNICSSKGLGDIQSEAACKEAAITHKLAYGGTVWDSKSPSCIYWTQKNLVFFNTNKYAWNTYMNETYSAICRGITQ